MLAYGSCEVFSGQVLAENIITHFFGHFVAFLSDTDDHTDGLDARPVSLDGGLPIEIDFLRYSSPILVTDLGILLLKAHAAELRGVLHIASSERINPFQFAERLAELADLNRPEFPEQTILESPITGFGKGETTLDCSLAAELLGVRMPLIDDGIGQFLRQADDGLLHKLRNDTAQVSRAA